MIISAEKALLIDFLNQKKFFSSAVNFRCKDTYIAKGPKRTGILLADVVQAVKDAYGENYLPSTPLDEQMLTDIYGLDMENVEEVIGEAPMISAHVDTFIAVKAKEGKGEAVEKELQEYLDYVVENSVNYPMNVAKVQAAKVVRHGDYVFYVMLGGYDDRTDVSEEESVKFAQEQVQIGVDAIDSCF